MKYELVEIEGLCGKEATIYDIRIEGEGDTLFNQFIEKYETSHESEINFIVNRLFDIANKFGARENFFKPDQGFPGSLIVRLRDKPNKELRLYCIKLGKSILILGGGGYKPKGIRSWQQSEELSKINYFLQQVSKDYKIKIENKEITFSPDNMKLDGNLIFGEEDE